jgi:hypothetical protein
MGWMWSSAPSPAQGSAPSKAEAAQKAARSRQAEEDQADVELAKFMAEIQADLSGGKPSGDAAAAQPEPKAPSATATPAAAQPGSSWLSLWGTSKAAANPNPPASEILSATAKRASDAPAQPARLDPLSESLLPTTMSCRQAFDTAFHCNSLGGQWTAVYREGTMRSCSEHWDDFWFCMRTRAYAEPQKSEAIRDHYRQRELRKYGHGRPNSTDVWESRSETVPPGSAFRQRYEMPDVSDEEWQRLEIERRRKVQEALRQEAAREGGRT